ncbi:MAG: phosphotriesterase-related protein, partial [Chloroflexota bacterium]|nr:phosphotriesterase-related protein [Chloroflexota bacterium]
MAVEGLAGKVQTVLGRFAPEKLGVTLPHEHLICDITSWFVEPNEATTKAMAHRLVSSDILWWLRYHPFQNLDDMRLHDEETAIQEALRFKHAGGDSIVEVSNVGLGRDPLALARISRATGLNVVMGSGYYVGLAMGPDVEVKSEEEICEEIVRDIAEGVGQTGVRAGIIGE